MGKYIDKGGRSIGGGPRKIPRKVPPKRAGTATGYQAELDKLLRDWENGKLTNDEYEEKSKALRDKYGIEKSDNHINRSMEAKALALELIDDLIEDLKIAKRVDKDNWDGGHWVDADETIKGLRGTIKGGWN